MHASPHRRLTDPRGAVARPAAFLDRDGVINVDRGYVHQPSDWQWIPEAEAAIAALNAAGYWVFVVTNQSGIARGLYSLDAMHQLHDHMCEGLRPHGAHIDAIYACPYHPQGTVAPWIGEHPDRKPGPGMLHTAMADYPVQRAASFLIGDKDSDLAAAAAAGVTGHRFTGGNLLDAVRPILVSRPQ